MGYLLPTEYVAYGLTAETTDDWVTMASALMEAYCHRPSLMATEYTERLRVTSGAYSVRVSYLPLVAATAGESPVLGLQVRLGMPRRGELSMGFWSGKRWRLEPRARGPQADGRRWIRACWMWIRRRAR